MQQDTCSNGGICMPAGTFQPPNRKPKQIHLSTSSRKSPKPPQTFSCKKQLSPKCFGGTTPGSRKPEASLEWLPAASLARRSRNALQVAINLLADCHSVNTSSRTPARLPLLPCDTFFPSLHPRRAAAVLLPRRGPPPPPPSNCRLLSHPDLDGSVLLPEAAHPPPTPCLLPWLPSGRLSPPTWSVPSPSDHLHAASQVSPMELHAGAAGLLHSRYIWHSIEFSS